MSVRVGGRGRYSSIQSVSKIRTFFCASHYLLKFNNFFALFNALFKGSSFHLTRIGKLLR